MTEIVIQGIGGRMGHVLCDMIAQREAIINDIRIKLLCIFGITAICSGKSIFGSN